VGEYAELDRLTSVTMQFAWAALAKLMQQNPADGLDYAVRFAGSNSRDSHESFRPSKGRSIRPPSRRRMKLPHFG
jgi:hypothetical protein